MVKVYQANTNQERAGKVYFTAMTIMKDKQGHFIMIKEPIQKDIRILN